MTLHFTELAHRGSTYEEVSIASRLNTGNGSLKDMLDETERAAILDALED